MRRYISATKNLTCVIQTPVWMVERAPGQHLEGISASARRDMAERTAQVITNDNNLSSIKWNDSETREHRNAFILYTICSENKSVFASIWTLNTNRAYLFFFVLL